MLMIIFLLGIALLMLMIIKFKINPFLALVGKMCIRDRYRDTAQVKKSTNFFKYFRYFVKCA